MKEIKRTFKKGYVSYKAYDEEKDAVIQCYALMDILAVDAELNPKKAEAFAKKQSGCVKYLGVEYGCPFTAVMKLEDFLANATVTYIDDEEK